MITRSENEAIMLIQSQNAVVKTISASPTSDRCLDYVLDQLERPSCKRPVKRLGNVHRHRVFNPKTRAWVYRANEEAVRGAPKQTQFTKKTSTTLIPTDGKMNLFKPKHGDSVGLLFDVQQCHLKDEKYIFPRNAKTDSKFWLKNKNQSEAVQALSMPESISLSALQARLVIDRLNDLIPAWNELNIGLSKNGLFAVFATNNQRDDRLKALHVKYSVMGKLGMDLPVLIITPKDGILVYNAEWQQHDLLLTKQYDYVDLPSEFVKGLRKQFKALHPQLALKQDKQPLEGFFDFLNSDGIIPELKLEVLKTLDYATLAGLKQMMPNRKIIQLAMDETKELSLINNEKALRALCQFNAYPHGFADILFTPGNEKNWLGRKQELVNVFLAHLFENIYNHHWLFRLAISKKNHDMIALLIKNNVFSDNLEKDLDILGEIYKHADIDLLNTIFAMPSFDYERFSVSAGKMVSPEWGSSYYVEDIKLCPILLTAACRDEAVLSEVVAKFPEHLVNAINQFKKYTQGWCWPKTFNIGGHHYMAMNSNLSETHAKLLLQLSSQVPSHQSYQLSYKEKRLVEDYLVRKVMVLNTEDALDAFWNQHKDKFCLNQRRHDIFDSIFRSKNHMTSIKKKLHSEIEKKRALINERQALRLA